MTEAVEQLKMQIGQLSTKERAELAHFCIRSLDGPGEDLEEAEIDAAWEAELTRRLEDFRSGKAVGIPLEQVMAKLRAKYR